MSTSLPRIGATTAEMTDAADIEAAAADALVALDAKAMLFGHGLLASRPAFGVQGRIYWATDVDGGTAYYDTGAAWKDVIPDTGINAGKLGVPDFAEYYLAEQLVITETTTVLSGAGNDWTVAAAGASEYVGWDATNRRLYAKIAGFFRVHLSGHVRAEPTATWDAGQFSCGIYIKKNGTGSGLSGDVSFSARTVAGSADEISFRAGNQMIVSLAANDYLQPTGWSSHTGAAAHTAIAADANTFVRLEYVGPTS